MRSRLLFAMCSAVFLSLLVCSARAAESHGFSAIKVRSQIDVARGRVWILTNRDVAVYDAVAKDKLRQLRLPDWFYAVGSYGCLPDFTLGPVGEAVIPSNVMPVLWRIDPKTLAVTKHELRLDTDNDKDVGFTEISHSSTQGEFIAVSGIDGTVWRIDRDLRYAYKTGRKLPRARNCGAGEGGSHDSK